MNNQVNLAKFEGKVYSNIIQKIKYLLWLITSNIFFLTNLPYPNFLKIFILKLFGARVGKGVVIKPWVKIKFPWELTIHNYVWIGESVWIDNISHVNIADNVCISQGALIITGNHNYNLISFDLISKPINIEEGSWLCANSIVTGGVTVKSHAVLSIASIATKDLNAFTIYKGNPAIEINKRHIL
jgi:putative colanic acid biosynthesis acetyltransferase WcaF